MGNMEKFLKSIQFYRKVHPEFKSTAPSTGVISIICAVVMTMLFFTQLRDFMTVKEKTVVVMDNSTMSKLRVNFNITMQYLPCRFASLDVADAHGEHYVNITAHIAKWRVLTAASGNSHKLDSRPDSVDRRESERTAGGPLQEALTHTDAELDVYNEEEEAALDVTPGTFEEVVRKHDLVLINFFAPWCIWSKRLKPVWEHSARLIADEPRVKLARVDCTRDVNRMLCRQQHVMAFPTIRVYRLGSTRSHEYYEGERQTHALLKFVKAELQGLGRRSIMQPAGNGQQEPVAPSRKKEHENQFRVMEVNDVVGEGQGPGMAAEGCMLTGYVMVNRAPGNFHIQGKSTDHSFDPDSLNTTHLVTALTFGYPLKRSDLGKVGDDVGRFVNTMEDTYYVSKTYGATRGHFLKVVHTLIDRRGRRLGGGEPFSVYQYSATETEYVEHEPSAKFSWDLSPLQVNVEEDRSSFSTFITRVCAIIGGAFTVMGFVDAFVYGALRVLVKQEMGKQG